MLTRRAFLGTSVTALGGLGLSPSWLAGAAHVPDNRVRRLVVLEMQGGLDGLAALQPLNDERLIRVRPTLARPAAQLNPIAPDCGMHPRLVRTAARFKNGGLGIRRGVGHSAPSLSHFESRDYWDEARVAPVRSGVGWLGKFGETLDGWR